MQQCDRGGVFRPQTTERDDSLAGHLLGRQTQTHQLSSSVKTSLCQDSVDSSLQQQENLNAPDVVLTLIDGSKLGGKHLATGPNEPCFAGTVLKFPLAN